VSISNKELLQILENKKINLNGDFYLVKEIKLKKLKQEKVKGRIICEGKLEILFSSSIFNENFLKNRFIKKFGLREEL
jgi:hypothetical protein